MIAEFVWWTGNPAGRWRRKSRRTAKKVKYLITEIFFIKTMRERKPISEQKSCAFCKECVSVTLVGDFILMKCREVGKPCSNWTTKQNIQYKVGSCADLCVEWFFKQYPRHRVETVRQCRTEPYLNSVTQTNCWIRCVHKVKISIIMEAVPRWHVVLNSEQAAFAFYWPELLYCFCPLVLPGSVDGYLSEWHYEESRIRWPRGDILKKRLQELGNCQVFYYLGNFLTANN